MLCADKTGTLTQNALTVTAVHAQSGFDESHVLGLAALASSDGGQDPVDAAIRAAAAKKPASDLPKMIKFVPFDPQTKMSEASAAQQDGAPVRVVKGAFAAVAPLAQSEPDASRTAHELEAQGFRVLAVAVGPPKAVKLAGIIALSDPPREDSAALVSELRTLGVRTVMVTGDAPATAEIVARAVGLEGPVCPPGPIPNGVRPQDFAVFAGVLPEGKYNLVKAFQKNGHIVGMCGDGANDAPALRQAQMGIAVSTATDVAKSAAGIVLTKPGLGGIVASVKEGRVTFQRILTYTLNSVTKKTVQVLFLAGGLVMTGHAILTPLLMVIIMLTGDLLGMSLTTDNVRPSPMPNAWRIGALTIAGVFVGVSELVFCTAILALAKFRLGLGVDALRTLAFVLIVFGNQATTYTNRERGRLGASRPSPWLVGSSVADVLIASTLAIGGIAMTALPLMLVGGNPCGGSGLCRRAGLCEGPRVPSPQDRVEPEKGRQRKSTACPTDIVSWFMAPALQNAVKELIVRDLDGKTVTLPLDRDRIALGRSTANELCYPEDIGLSRQHLVLVRHEGQWEVQDLGSKNGTLLNGRRVEGTAPFNLGDQIAAGHLIIEFAQEAKPPEKEVEFVDNSESFSNTATTVVANLDTALGPRFDDSSKTYVMQSNQQMQALIRAGRELAAHNSLAELFQVIMDLSVDVVMGLAAAS